MKNQENVMSSPKAVNWDQSQDDEMLSSDMISKAAIKTTLSEVKENRTMNKNK